MDFVYYVIRKKDMVVVDGAEDMVSAVKIAQQKEGSYIILQGCVLTEIDEDANSENGNQDSIEEVKAVTLD